MLFDWFLGFEILEKVDKVALVGLQGDLIGELGHAQFLDNLQDIKFLVEFAAGRLE